MESNFTAVAERLKPDVGHLDSRLTNLRSTTDTLQKSQNTEIGFVSDDLVALTNQVGKLEDYISQVQLTLNGQSETLSMLGRDQNTILVHAYAFAPVYEQADDRLNRLEATPIIPVPQTPLLTPPSSCFIPFLPLA